MSNRTQNLEALLAKGCEEHVFSAYQVYAQWRDEHLSLFGGMTSYWPDRSPVSEGSLFDIGSVTKAIVGTSLSALMVHRERLALTDKLGGLLPRLKKSALADLELGDLLSHSAGLKAWAPIYREVKDRTALLDWFNENAATILEHKPREKPVYSDLGFLLVGAVLEAALGDIRAAYLKEVAEPLSLKETDYRPQSTDVVATEYSAHRKRPLKGEVFDENCGALGGVTAHAGLFSSARGLAPFCREWLSAVRGESSWLAGSIAQLFSRRTSRAQGSSWAYGWDTKSEKGSSAGAFLSGRSFGHLGYPGCSIWLDPEKSAYVIFFTNRIHPSRYDERIRAMRPLVHDEVARALGMA